MIHIRDLRILQDGPAVVWTNDIEHIIAKKVLCGAYVKDNSFVYRCDVAQATCEKCIEVESLQCLKEM